MATATLTHIAPAGADMKTLIFDTAIDSYTAPGQYLVVTVEGQKPGYFAVASAPGQPITLLIKEGGGAADAMLEMQPGDTVDLSDAQGNGFSLQGHESRELICLANGSGISAVRPVVLAELAAGLPRPVHVYLGVRHANEVAFADDLDAWAAAGVHTHICVSQPSDEWAGRKGYVQHAAKADGLVREGTAVVLCGVRGMADEAKQLWGAVDAPLLSNF